MADFDETVEIKVKLEEGGIMPKKAHDADAAYDLYTPVSFKLKPHDRAVIDLGIHMVIPEGYCGEIISKSGLSAKYGITAVGLVDAGYTGTIKAMVYRDDSKADANFGSNTYTFEVGDKLTQIKIAKVPKTELTLTDELPDTERNEHGFGDSGRR